MDQNPNYYQQAPPPAYNRYNDAPVMTVGNWIITMIIMVIPIVNVVMLIVWAASSTENPNRKNWAVAQLIFIAIGIIIWILFAGIIIGMLGGLAGSYS